MSQITLNLPIGKISSKIAIYTTLVNPITKYALVVSPIATAIEDKLPLRKSALLGVTVSILLPCLCYLKIKKPSYLEVVFIGMILSCLEVTDERFGQNWNGSEWTESMGRCSIMS
ncbi:hypothetical protein KY290_025656 [Solanum tuberosum]|uniref:Uncharacterized protein n=1 Tax=Solanum tuberosum TaxID=4113 RepID=A0ABQ7UU74_SOLTU|nr:hypothetical protein KY289_024728 [Solanum tuberosum]KAH0755386.1 hypothetical protein KY290_025656 [Solanum tuberosum]